MTRSFNRFFRFSNRGFSTVLATTIVVSCAAWLHAAAINTSTLSQNDWYSDDTRAILTQDGFADGTNLIGLTKTDLGTGASPAAGVAGHDAAIDEHIIFSTPTSNQPPTAPPGGTHQGVANLTLEDSVSGKSQMSHIINGAAGSGGGHAAGSIFASPFDIEYHWMGDGTAGVTTALKIGIKTDEFAALGSSSRTGENVWDKLLVYEPSNGNGGVANGTWTTETVDRDNGSWWMFDRVRGFSGTAQSNPLSIADISTSGLIYSGADTFSDIYDLIVDPDSIITSIQFGIGSGNANGNVFVNQLETSFYRSGDTTTFGLAPLAEGVVPEPSTLVLAGLGLLVVARRRRRR